MPQSQPLSPQPPKSRPLSTVRPLLAAIVVGALLAPVTAQAGKHLYRFRNAEGQLEISHTIPSDRVTLGYDVIDRRSGRLIEKVDPQKSPEEIARIERETKARNACKDALARVNSMYQSELDIEAAEEQTLESLDGRIANAQASLRQTLDQKRDFEATAAQLERSGKSLDPTLVTNIERAEAQAGNLQREIEQRHREQDEARIRFANDLALFRQATCANEADLGFNHTDMANVEGGDS
jgi:hypothetical protein